MKNKKFNIIFIIVIFIIVWIKGAISLDPDFGWHLRMGQVIRESGIPKGDPFSYTMPSFPFVDHEWLTNVIISKLFPLVDRTGLAGISAVLVLLTLIIASRGGVISISGKRNLFLKDSLHKKIGFEYLGVNIVFLLSAAVIFPFAGVRPQVQSWFYLSILLWLLFKKGAWKKWRYAVPILILLWSNLHGSFAVGITTLFAVVTLRIIRRRSVQVDEVVVLLLSILATFINPYRGRLWGEVWMQITDSKLRWTINEWKPALTMLNLPVAASIALFCVFVWKQKKIFKLEELVLFFAFLAQAMASRRHLPLWIIVATPLAVKAIYHFYQQVSKIKGGVERFKKAYRIAWLAVLLIVVSQVSFDLQGASLTEENFYPQKALRYLQTNMPEGEIFSRYGWGGYLIWKLPEKKVFIDGRMPSWRWEAYPAQETGSAFDDYTDLLAGEIEYKEVFDKYSVDTVLWETPYPKTLFGKLSDIIEFFLALFGRERRDFDLLEQLEKDGWREVYKDNVAVVYKKPG